MADNLEVRGLELKIQTTSSNATQSLEKLSSAIRGLQYTKGRAAKLEKMSQELVRFSNTLKGTVPSSISKLTQFANALTAWGNAQESMGKIKFGKSQVNALAYMGAALSGIGNSLKGVDTSSIEKLSAFAPALNSLSDIKKPSIPKDLGERLGAVAEVLGKTDTTKLTEQTKQFVTALQPLSELKMRFPNMSAFADNLNKIDMQKLAVQSRLAATAMQPLVATMARLADSFKSIPSNLMIGALVRVSKNSATATPQVNRFNGALKALEKTWRSLGALARGANYVLPFRGLGSTIGGVKKKMDNLFSSLKRIAFYRAIRTFIKNITEGFKIGTQNLYYYSQAVGTKFAPAMDLLATDLLYLRNSIGAAASPLIEKLAPAVDYATDRIVDMINVVNQLMAKLTGKSQWTKALKYPAEYAEETKNSAKAAKDYLLEFDELHVLDDNSGGRGADALDYSRMFEEKELDRSFATWVDDFKDAIANGDWYGAGEILGDKIDDAIKSIDGTALAYDLTDKVNDIVDLSRGLLDRLDTTFYGWGLANFLNDCISNIDEYDLGDLMGTKVQKIIDFAFGFAYGFNWEGAGLGINDFLEGYFEAINGEELGSTASGLYNGVLTTLKTVFTNMKLSDDISTDIAGFFNGIDWEDTIYNTLTTAGSLLHWLSTTFVDTIDKIEWSDVASAMGRGFKKAVAEIPWDEIWDNINTLFNAAANFTFDMTQEWGFDIGKNISIALNNGYYDWHTGEWVDLQDQLYSEGGTYQGQLFDAILSGDITSIPGALFQDASHLLEYYAGQGHAGSGSIFDKFTSALFGGGLFGPSLFSGYTSSNDSTELWAENMSHVLEDMGEDFNAWTTHVGLGYGYNAMEGGLFTNQFINDFLERTGLSGLTTNQLQGIANGTLGLPSGVTLSTEDMELLQSILDKTDSSIKGGSRTVKTATKSWNGYKTALDNAKDSAKALTGETGTLDTAVTTMSEDIVSPLTNFKNTFNGAKDSASRAINDTKTNFVNGVNGMNTALVTPLSTLKSSVTGTFKDIKKDAVGAIKDTNTELTTPLDNVKNKIVTAFKNTNTELNTPITNIRKRGTNAINGTITDIATPLTNLKNKIVNSYKDTNKDLNAPVSDIRKQAPDAIKNSTNDLTSPLSTFKDAMVNGFMGVVNDLKSQDFVGNATGLWRDVKNNIIPIGNSILTAGELIANGMNAAFTNLSNKIGGYTLSLPKEFGGGTIRFNFPKSSDISVPRIPAMAQGGLVTSPTTALVGEAGREAVIPLENNTEWMDMLASRLVVGMSGATMYDNNDRPIQVHVTLDGREIYQNQEKVRRSIGYNVGGGAFA